MNTVHYSKNLLNKLSNKAKKEIDKAMDKVIKDYGSCLRALGDNSSEDYMIGYLKGLFDGEGCISKQSKIIISNTEKKLLLKAETYLVKLGFNPSIKKYEQVKSTRKDIFRLFVCSKEEVLKFYNLIGTNSTFKEERFKRVS